ncbi:MAG TPA: hypothetical protein VHX88_13780 [Solirubrobacteraceae bacterium]|nr:hypothetical protein [Solirubrobacteraceae bacterium]
MCPLLGAGALAAVIAGCGGAPSKASFIASADKDCAAAQAQISKVAKPSLGRNATRGQAVQALATYLDRELAVSGQLLKELKGLSQPTQDKTLLLQYLDSLQQGLTDYENLDAALKSRNAKAITQAYDAANSTQAATLAKAYGFKVCSVAAQSS